MPEQDLIDMVIMYGVPKHWFTLQIELSQTEENYI